MMNYCDINSIWQVILLVLSLLTVIALTACCVLLFKNRYGVRKQVIVAAVLVFNVVLYVMMQLDNRVTGTEYALKVPYVLLFAVILLSQWFTVWSILQETKNRKTINNSSIKESFDNLPTGVCFFNEAGLPMLCNSAMHRFFFAVSGKDIQFVTDLEECFADAFSPLSGVTKEDNIFVLADGTAWHLEKRMFTHENGSVYTQYIAADVTDLQKNREELIEDNTQLRKAQMELKKLSANVVTITREEEILNTKMRVHDEMGRCLVEARKYLRDGSDSIPESVVHSWQRAVSMLKYNNETSDEDMLSQIRKTCESIKLGFHQTGTLPKEESAAYILTCAVRECVTNAVCYAAADDLYAEFSENEEFATVHVTNSGKQPDSQIIEGGGLSTLRRRVERAGGTMTVQSLPKFKLTVTVPKGKEGVL
jgi:NADH:ubiquinone oxidoreductase subunit 6 (subunit J)